MAGSRAQSSQPRWADARPERQRAMFLQRLANAHGPRHRMSIAFDYLRMRMTDMDSADQARIAEQVVRLLTSTADQITPSQEGSS